MRTIEARPYTMKDMIAILSEAPGDRERDIETAVTRLKHGPAYSFYIDGHLVACAGVTIYWEGMGEVWLATSAKWKQFAKEVVVQTPGVLDQLQDRNHLRRIQADVVADNHAARRFVEHFGFTAEGTMKKYDVLGRDCVRYARIREGV